MISRGQSGKWRAPVALARGGRAWDHPGHTQERLRERGTDWPHARALRDAVSGRRVRL